MYFTVARGNSRSIKYRVFNVPPRHSLIRAVWLLLKHLLRQSIVLIYRILLSPKMFKLDIYLDGSLASTEFFNPRGSRYTIGRGTNCDRVISDPKISRAHCTLLKSGQDWVLYSGDVDNPVEASQGFLVGLDKRQTITLTPGISVTLANFSNIKVVLSRTTPNSEKELPRLGSGQSTNNESEEDTLLEDPVDNEIQDEGYQSFLVVPPPVDNKIQDEGYQSFLIVPPPIDRATTNQTLSPGFLLSALDTQTVNLENALKPEFKIIDDRICTLEDQILVKSENRKKKYLDLSKVVTYLGVLLLAVTITASFKGDPNAIQQFLSVISGIISIGMILKGQDSK